MPTVAPLSPEAIASAGPRTDIHRDPDHIGHMWRVDVPLDFLSLHAFTPAIPSADYSAVT
jgi:hypothetical protein